MRLARRACARFSSSRVRLFGVRLFGVTEAKIFPNVCDETIVDFRMSQHGSLLAGAGVEVNVVVRPRAEKNTALADELADEVLPLYTAMVFSRYSAGTSSRNIIR